MVSFRTRDDRRPSKFIVLADSMKSTIKMAWEHGGTDFQSRFDRSTRQAQEMKEGRYAFCESRGADFLFRLEQKIGAMTKTTFISR